MAILNSLEEHSGIPFYFILLVIIAIFLGVLYQVSSSFLFDVIRMVLITIPVWLPPVLIISLWRLWMTYARASTFEKESYTLLEIRLPREITKSPLAMEAVLNGMHLSPGEGTWWDKYVKGKTRPWFSLELVSIGGEIRFFIWTRTFFKDIIEAQIYAQYPEIEIYEVDDYTQGVFFEKGKTAVWGCDFKLTKADPYPIKTYVDYGLDKDPKEEQKIDPLSNVLEFLGHLQAGHQVWMQILIRVNKNERHKKGTWFGKTGWKNEAKDEMNKIIDGATPPGGNRSMFNLTKGQTDVVNALERSVSKHGFDCGIRGIYIADDDKFQGNNIAGMLGTFKQFSSNSLNGIMPARWLTIFDYPWQDYKDMRQNSMKKKIIDAYKRRSWFHAPYKTPYFVLNTEELATIFHFPGGVVQTPTMSRVSSKKAEAPINLPTDDSE